MKTAGAGTSKISLGMTMRRRKTMKTKPPKETTAGRISQARLTRLTRQNEKLEIEVQRLKGEVGPIETFKQEVLRANAVVKTQLLALPFRLADQLATATDSHDCSQILQEAITQACNDLAYGTPAEDGICPCCGQKKEEPL